MGPPERLNLRWDDFEANVRHSFRNLRNEIEFFDVTVVSDGGKQVEANKVVLAGGSSFFHKILKENPHPHPLIYLKGVGYEHLVYLLDFVYTGETSIVQDDLNDFLDIAQDLKVKGLTVTSSNQTDSISATRTFLPNQDVAKESCPSPSVSHPHPHPVTSASPTPHQDQMAAQEPGPSLRMLRQSRLQGVTSTCPDFHQSQAFGEEVLPPTVSHLYSVISPNKTVWSPSISNPRSAKSAFPQGPSAANETTPSANILNPGNLKSAYQCQVVTDQHVPSCKIPHCPGVKSAPRQGQVALEEAVSLLRLPRPLSVISSNPYSGLSKDFCEEGDAEQYNVAYGVTRGLEENKGKIELSVEQEQNNKLISTWKEPKEEIMESSNDMVIREAADSVLKDGQMPHDWYELDGRNKYDKNNITEGQHDLKQLEVHIRNIHTKAGICPECGEYKAELKDHIRRVHLNQVRFTCPEQGCKFASFTKQHFKRHKKLVHENSHLSCPKCGKLVKHIYHHLKHAHKEDTDLYHQFTSKTGLFSEFHQL